MPCWICITVCRSCTACHIGSLGSRWSICRCVGWKGRSYPCNHLDDLQDIVMCPIRAWLVPWFLTPDAWSPFARSLSGAGEVLLPDVHQTGEGQGLREPLHGLREQRSGRPRESSRVVGELCRAVVAPTFAINTLLFLFRFAVFAVVTLLLQKNNPVLILSNFPPAGFAVYSVKLNLSNRFSAKNCRNTTNCEIRRPCS